VRLSHLLLIAVALAPGVLGIYVIAAKASSTAATTR
jgi:hypothetical protein